MRERCLKTITELARTDERIEDRRAAIYDPVADRYETVGAPVEGRFWPFVVTLADGRVLVGGGDDEPQVEAVFAFVVVVDTGTDRASL